MFKYITPAARTILAANGISVGPGPIVGLIIPECLRGLVVVDGDWITVA